MPFCLTELEPRFLSVTGRSGMGLSFVCPCPTCDEESLRLAVWFENPIDGGAPHTAEYLWKRAGTTFEDLTLAPSVNAEPHWHGFIQNGLMVGGIQRK